jgi:hypothetical protein
VKHLRWIVLGSVALALCAAQPAAARPPGGAVISPGHAAGGLSGPQLLGESWAIQLEQPADAFLGGCLFVGNRDKVAVPVPDENLTAFCTVKPGTAVYILPGSECSDVEDPPFFGADAAEQRACAIAFDRDFFVAASISVDGGTPVDMLRPRFEVVSPQMTVDLPEDNLLGVPPGPATFVAHAWAVLVRGLPPGEHVISVDVTTSDGVTTTVPLTIDVVPRGHAR